MGLGNLFSGKKADTNKNNNASTPAPPPPVKPDIKKEIVLEKSKYANRRNLFRKINVKRLKTIKYDGVSLDKKKLEELTQKMLQKKGHKMSVKDFEKAVAKLGRHVSWHDKLKLDKIAEDVVAKGIKPIKTQSAVNKNLAAVKKLQAKAAQKRIVNATSVVQDIKTSAKLNGQGGEDSFARLGMKKNETTCLGSHSQGETRKPKEKPGGLVREAAQGLTGGNSPANSDLVRNAPGSLTGGGAPPTPRNTGL